MAIKVSNASELASAIDTINNNIDSNKYVTILITNDINLNGTNNRTIPSKWKDKNIILEKYNSNPQNVTIKWLTIEENDTVGLKGIKIERVVAAVATGSFSSFVLDSDGKLWASGYNYCGQLGLGDSGDGTDRNLFQPVTIPNLPSSAKIVLISAGIDHSLALDSNGKIWATGDNTFGQLGLDDTNDPNSFQPVTIPNLPSSAKIVSIAAGYYHSFALDSNGKLWATGDNWGGQLGLGDTNDRNLFQPVTIPNLPSSAKIVSISAGMGYYSLALDSNGKLWATGDNWGGPLGLGDTNDRNLFQPVTIPNLPSSAKIVSISAGNHHSLALDSNGKLWASGYNYYGQLGLGDSGAGAARNLFQPVTIPNLPSSAKIVSIAAGYYHSFALDGEGELRASGYNYYSQLGLGGTNDRNLFQPVTIPNLVLNAKIVSIEAGSYYSFALDSEGELRATGDNWYGQLGLGDDNDRNEFMPVPSPWL
jgi:alpha-tubulin suppressor-like RCC1 family protein